MKGQKTQLRVIRFGGFVALLAVVCSLLNTQVSAQAPSSSSRSSSAGKAKLANGQTAAANAPNADSTNANKEDEAMIRDIFRRFHENYRLGPDDELAIRVKGQPDYSLDKAKVSPVGSIYHPLLGEVSVAGMTIVQLKAQLTKDLSEYLVDPLISVELLEAHSAKIGVLGEVAKPGIILMTRPLSVLDAITEAGGILDTGKKSGVTVLRLGLDGTRKPIKVNVKRILEGKADPEENLALRAGDTVIVDGNFKKVLPLIASIAGFANLMTLISVGGR